MSDMTSLPPVIGKGLEERVDSGSVSICTGKTLGTGARTRTRTRGGHTRGYPKVTAT